LKQFAKYLETVPEDYAAANENTEYNIWRISNALANSPKAYLPLVQSSNFLDFVVAVLLDPNCPPDVLKPALALIINILFEVLEPFDFLTDLLAQLFPLFQTPDPGLVYLLSTLFHNILIDHSDLIEGFIAEGYFDLFMDLFDGCTDPLLLESMGRMISLFSGSLFPWKSRLRLFPAFSHLISHQIFDVFLDCVIWFLDREKDPLYRQFYSTIDFISPVVVLIRFPDDRAKIEYNPVILDKALDALNVILVRAPETFSLAVVPIKHVVSIACSLSTEEHSRLACKVLLRYVAMARSDGVSDLSQQLFFGTFHDSMSEMTFAQKVSVAKVVIASFVECKQGQFEALLAMDLINDIIEVVKEDVEHLVERLLLILGRAQRYGMLEHFLRYFDDLVEVYEQVDVEQIQAKDQLDLVLGELAAIGDAHEQISMMSE
jgi:hypothetical protein